MLGHRVLNMADYITILKRRWWVIVLPAVIFPVLAVIATYFITPEYVSSTLVLIDEQKVPTDFVKPVVTESLDSRLAYMEEQVLSRSSIQPIIEKYNLYANQHLSMDARIALMRDPKTLKIEPVESDIARAGGLPGFTIEFTANDPHTAQQVCSDITGLFTSSNLKSRQAAAEGTTDFLKEQLDNAKRSLDDQDAKVAAFQRQYFGMLPDDQGNNVNIMSSLNSQLDATTQAIQTLEQNQSVGETMLAQATQPVAASTPAIQTVGQEQKELDDLLTQEADLTAHYTPDYPDVKQVQRKIADLRSQMAQEAAAPAAPAAPTVNRPDSANVVQLRAQLRGIATEIQAKRKQQDDLQQQIHSYESRISSSPQVAEQYKELTRDYDTEQAEYNQLLKQADQSQMTTDMEHRQEGETFTLLDASNLPTEPTFPKQSVFAMGGLGAGLALGVLITAFLEYKDTALRTERDIWEFTQLPTLAVLAWSGDVAQAQSEKTGRLKRLFSRKPKKELLADAPG